MNNNSAAPMWNKDYVDVHGRDLKAIMTDDGTIFIPLNEIRKSGFHVFPRSEFHSSKVGKSMVISEFHMYLLGAAREFLIQNNIQVLNKDDISETIEKCREQLIKEDQTVSVNSNKPAVLGRTLLSDPVIINQEVRSALQKNNQQIANDNSHITENRDGHLRMPYNKGKINQQQNSHHQGLSRNRLNGNFSPSAAFASKRDDSKILNEIKRDNDSKSVSEIDESETFLRLSDCKLDRIKLKKTPQKVKVVHIESNEKKKYWVHLVENEDKLMNIIEKCFEASVYSPIFTPKLGDICMAMSIGDNLWYRAVVQRVSPIIKVHFIDFGNNAVVSQVKKIPDELRSIAAQAVRITLSADFEPKEFNIDDILSIKAIKEYPDSTVLVCEEVSQRATTPSTRIPSGGAQNDPTFEKFFWKQSVYSTALIDEEVVKIIAYKNGKFYLQNKEHFIKLKSIMTFIKDLTKQPVKSVEKNQLVICRKDGEEQMCRAVIRDVDDEFVSVHFIDFNSVDSMSIKALYAAPKALLAFPIPLIESPTIKGYSEDVDMTDDAEALLDDVILNRQKFNVSVKGAEFDLLMNGKSLSELLFPCKSSRGVDRGSHNGHKSEGSSFNHSLTSPKQLHEEPTKRTDAILTTSERTMYESMSSFEPPMGLGDYMLTVFKDSQDFTITSTGLVESDMLSKCTCIEVDETEGPYEPQETEMVLARFEGGWYRGVVLEAPDDGKYQIIFVDYGNTVELTKDDIRKFPNSFISIPMLGLMCRMDVPPTNAVNKRLEELLKPENIYGIDIVSHDPDNALYTVQIPKVLNTLKNEGLL
ncbi:hypothetical protein WA026_018567 [Henosepilachna vigintioctopunctata]